MNLTAWLPGTTMNVSPRSMPVNTPPTSMYFFMSAPGLSHIQPIRGSVTASTSTDISEIVPASTGLIPATVVRNSIK